jgi:hypothetical protein
MAQVGPPKLTFRDGFNWKLVAWGRPDAPVRPLCGYCHAMLPEAPLILTKSDGSLVQFCDDCVEKWIVSALE